MKKSEKTKGREKVAARRQQYKLAGIVAVVAIIVICAAVYLVFYSPGVVAAAGDTVSVTYTGMFENKTIFDSNVNGTPLTFTIGSGTMISGFDAAVRGMRVNEEKVVNIPADQGYVYNPGLVQTVPRSMFQTNQTISPGEQFSFQSSVDGRTRVVTVLSVNSTGVTVDANSPLAGQNLIFDIKIDSIQKASTGSNATATATS
ncbi:MAG: FKBP-type peptidyl-prolyl cis-trans isomerase [Methanoregula sp.]|uniref:FKBP-type peptidyl-prolyl cis-trans isomerase n=1 Tax=Methanoregula sp. TaxID=2052170 RepID=UPI003C4EAABA